MRGGCAADEPKRFDGCPLHSRREGCAAGVEAHGAADDRKIELEEMSVKKIVAIVLAVLLALSTLGVLAEEQFTIHSNVTFGSTMAEVKKCERENGFDNGIGAQLEEEGYDSDMIKLEIESYGLDYDSITYDDLESIGINLDDYKIDTDKTPTGNTQYRIGPSTIAGLYPSWITYQFFDDKLFSAQYDFPSGNQNTGFDSVISDYEKLSSALASKYGATEYTYLSNKRNDFPNIYHDIAVSVWGKHDYWKDPERSWANTDYAFEKYEEWIIPQDDGTVIVIHHCLAYDKNATFNEKYHWLFYTCFDEELASSEAEKNASINDDI